MIIGDSLRRWAAYLLCRGKIKGESNESNSPKQPPKVLPFRTIAAIPTNILAIIEENARKNLKTLQYILKIFLISSL